VFSRSAPVDSKKSPHSNGFRVIILHHDVDCREPGPPVRTPGSLCSRVLTRRPRLAWPSRLSAPPTVPRRPGSPTRSHESATWPPVAAAVTGLVRLTRAGSHRARPGRRLRGGRRRAAAGSESRWLGPGPPRRRPGPGSPGGTSGPRLRLSLARRRLPSPGRARANGSTQQCPLLHRQDYQQGSEIRVPRLRLSPSRLVPRPPAIIETSPEPMVTARLGQMVTLSP
jgi:hypothetical protein